jgi:hypothetical protein
MFRLRGFVFFIRFIIVAALIVPILLLISMAADLSENVVGIDSEKFDLAFMAVNDFGEFLIGDEP